MFTFFLDVRSYSIIANRPNRPRYARFPKTANNIQKKIQHRGASIATPDKVENTLNLIKKTSGSNEVDLDAFVGAAVRGRANTAFAALTFIVIQIIVFGSLFIRPLIQSLTGVDIIEGQGYN